MKPIEIHENLFHLQTENTSYLFRVDPYGHLEHIHYGRRVSSLDADALAYKRTITYGSVLNVNDADPAYTMDALPQEYPSYGRGDFNEAAIEIRQGDSYTLDLTYAGHEVLDGNASMSALPSSYGANSTLVIHLTDVPKNIAVDLIYALYPDTDVITRRAIVTNRSSLEIEIRKILSSSLDIFEGDLDLIDFHGAWIKEAHTHHRPVEHGTYVIDSKVGFSSAKCNPGFLVEERGANEDHGKVWGFNLVYSGNHYSSISKNEYGIVRIMSGIQPSRFSCVLREGESFETPEAVLSFSNRGRNGLSQHFHDFINEHIVRSDWKKKERPVLINSWEAFGFDFKKDSLVKLASAAKKLGMELFVLDDGWFGRRSDDTKGLGDYDCNTKKIPGGIKALSKEIHDQGLLFGLWVEPESVNRDSVLYETHPDWAIEEKDRESVLGRHQLLLDLTRKDVRDYIVENVSKLIDENDVDYIKWDMNRMMCSVNGLYSHNYILGLYEVLDRIFTKRPHVLLESCSSGGNRFDLGMLCYSPQIWASDDTDPIERLDIQKGLSYLYPLSTMGAHVSASPHSQTLRDTPLETRFHVSAYGCLGYELDLGMLTPLEKEEIRRQILYYKEHRKTFQFGRFYRSDDKDQEVFEVLNDEEAIVSKFRRIVHAAPEIDRLIVKGLEDTKMYDAVSRSFTFSITRFGNLINYLLPVRVNARGILVNEVSKYKGIEAPSMTYEASGSALENGISLHKLYLGTGHDEKLRLPLDYGSDMFLIKEKDNESGQKE